MPKLTVFIFFITLFTLFIGGVSWFILYVFSTLLGLDRSVMSGLVYIFIIAPLVLTASMLVGNKYYSKINSRIYFVSAFWIPALLYLFIVALVISGLYLIGFSAGVLVWGTGVLLVLTGFAFVAGIRIALNPKIVTYELTSEKLAPNWADKKIVLFSDVHLGMARNEKFMKHIVDKVNSLSPDIVFIAGDLIDGPVFPYAQGLAPLAELKSTHGVFYTAGNHDEYNPDQEKYYQELEKHVTVLNDKKTLINGTQIIGVMYAQESKAKTVQRLASTGFDNSTPSIVLLHDPKNVHALVQSGVTLGLSGHTHDGQFFPFTLIVRAAYGRLRKGVHYIEETVHLTSPGVGTAGPMMRFGTQPEIAVIQIR